MPHRADGDRADGAAEGVEHVELELIDGARRQIVVGSTGDERRHLLNHGHGFLRIQHQGRCKWRTGLNDNAKPTHSIDCAVLYPHRPGTRVKWEVELRHLLAACGFHGMMKRYDAWIGD